LQVFFDGTPLAELKLYNRLFNTLKRFPTGLSIQICKEGTFVEKKVSGFSWAKFKKTDPTLVAVSLGHGITDWYQNSLFIILPYLSKDLGLTYSQVGILMGWNYFTNFFVNLPGGLIVDMVGKTGLLLGLAMALTGLPYFFLGFSTSYVMAMVFVTFVGIGNNLWHPAALSFLARRYPERKGFAIALHAMGGHMGNTFSPIAIGVALTFLTWRHVLFLNFFPGIVMGFILWRLLAKLGTVRTEGKKKKLSLKEYGMAVKTMARNKSVLLLCSLAGMRSMTSIGLFTFLPLYLAHELKYPPALVGTYMTLVQGAGIFASPISGTVSDRKGRRPVLAAGLLTTSFLLVALVVFRLQFFFVGVLAFLGFFLFSLQPVILAWMMDVAPKNVSGTTVSALFGVQSLFASFSPAVCGFIADRFGILYSFYFLASTIFAANFLVYLIPATIPKEEAALVP
jgi:MFS transporter, FSR family, fosmidomycin resistance protein